MSDDVHDRLRMLEHQVSGLSKRLAEVERELDSNVVHKRWWVKDRSNSFRPGDGTGITGARWDVISREDDDE